MQIGRARESWLIYHKVLALACTSNLHEPHQNNHSLIKLTNQQTSYDWYSVVRDVTLMFAAR